MSTTDNLRPPDQHEAGESYRWLVDFDDKPCAVAFDTFEEAAGFVRSLKSPGKATISQWKYTGQMAMIGSP